MVEQVETSVRKDISKSEREVYKMLVRPAMTCGLEMVAPTKRQELKVLLGVSRMDKVRNEYIRVLALFKHAHRRDSQQTLMMHTVHE